MDHNCRFSDDRNLCHKHVLEDEVTECVEESTEEKEESAALRAMSRRALGRMFAEGDKEEEDDERERWLWLSMEALEGTW